METPFGTLPDRYIGDISMTEAHEFLSRGISRRAFLRAAVAGAAAVTAGPVLWQRPGLTAVAPRGAHLQFGADPTREAAISWYTTEAVQDAVLDIGLDPSFGTTLPADSRAVVGINSLYHHARVGGLAPGTTYHYRARHLGADGVAGTFRTAPSIPEPFTFTSFGDQGVSSSAAATTARVLANAPAFHFHVGDLCYAYSTGTGDYTKPLDLSAQLRGRFTNPAVWDQWLNIVTARAAVAPWMPTVGNHEMEYGYGPLGYDGHGARFTLPGNGAPGAPVTYWFRYGNIAVIALDGNDASDEIPANRGYAGAAQDAWLRATLAQIRSDPTLDFVVVGFHNCNYCTNVVHASDGGTRARWGLIFDEFAVDLVINGHNHCYERTHPVRGGRVTREVPAGGTVRPASDGTTYITAGGGGQVAYQTTLYPASYVTILGARVPETAEWSATRYLNISLIAVDVVPPDASGATTMTVRALAPDGAKIEEITLARG